MAFATVARYTVSMPIQVTGRVDENHILTAEVPPSVAAGEVKIVLIPQSDEDDAGEAWGQGVAEQWADELSDPRQDIYTIGDGEPIDAPR